MDDLAVLDKLAFVLHQQGCGDEVCVCVDDARALLPVVREIVTEELREAAAAYESDAEQPHLNYLADHVYRPGDCLSSIWLRARADALTKPIP